MATKLGSKRITATLIRGRYYSYKSVKFYKGEPQEVTPEFAAELEDLVDEVVDREGELIEKPRFKLNYNAEPIVSKATLTGVRKKRPVLQTSANRGDISKEDLSGKKRSTIRKREKLG